MTFEDKYLRLVLHRAGMLGPERVEQAKREINDLIASASDNDLERISSSVALVAACQGEDYWSEYDQALAFLVAERDERASIREER